MNKNILTIIIVLTLLGGLGFYLYEGGVNNRNTQNQNLQTQPGEQEEDKQFDIPEGSLLFEITPPSTASYTVQKRFFGAENAVVTAKTNNVTGMGWINLESNTAFINAQVDLQPLTSDSSRRDEDVISFFDTTVATLLMEEAILNSRVELGKEFNEVLEVQLTINGITKTVEFDAIATVNKESFTAKGNATILMSEFGITPPSVLNVYGVDDETELNFEVIGAPVINN